MKAQWALCMKRGMKIDRHETKKFISPSGQIYLNVYMMKRHEIYVGVDFISAPILNSTPDMSCSVHVCSIRLMTHFSDFFS